MLLNNIRPENDRKLYTSVQNYFYYKFHIHSKHKINKNYILILNGDNKFFMKTSEIPIDILLVEDNPGDVRLVVETFKEAKFPHNLAIAYDGMKATQILNSECRNSKRPKLIILDLNLPKKNGWEVLKEIKNDKNLKKIPVVILTTSTSKKDIEKSYCNHANAYLTKPLDLQEFTEVVKSIHSFWIQKAKLP